MRAEHPERRKYQRVFFSEADGVIGTFTLAGYPDRIMRANVADLCEEGLCLILTPDGCDPALQQGDRLTLMEIRGGTDGAFLTDLELEVKWTLNLKHCAIGCEFLKTSHDLIERLRAFIDSREHHP